MVKSILLYLSALVICAASIHFFYRNNYLVAVPLLIFAISLLYGERIRPFAEAMSAITMHSEWERNCNNVIEMTIGVEALLKHKSVADLFDRIKNKMQGEPQKAEWLALLLENYKEKSKNPEGLEKIRFNIKNNILWRNGEVEFSDSVYHEIFIPYDLHVEKPSFSITPEIQFGLKVRLFIVNGIVKLQIGEFSKDSSPDVVGDRLAVYRTHETVTSFPLIYFSSRHRIPERYLNLSAYATESYWEDKNYWIKKKDKKSDWTSDWKKVVSDVADYKYLCSTSDWLSRRCNKVTKRFDEIREEWLKKEGFMNLLKSQEEDDYDDWNDSSIYYSNQYLTIYVVNQNEYKERWHQYLYPDYYEERP
jgi:hypothetical protein